MKFKKTKIKGVFIIELEFKEDARGYFSRVFDIKEIKDNTGIDFTIAQINRSLTKKKGTIRGLHYQKPPFQEEKILQCIKGEVQDVIVDLRPNSSTFKKWISVKLTDKNKTMVLVAKGCAHGIQSLTNNCIIEYFASEYYSPNYEDGVRWDDPSFNIHWPLTKPFLSEKDKAWKDFKN